MTRFRRLSKHWAICTTKRLWRGGLPVLIPAPANGATLQVEATVVGASSSQDVQFVRGGVLEWESIKVPAQGLACDVQGTCVLQSYSDCFESQWMGGGRTDFSPTGDGLIECDSAAAFACEVDVRKGGSWRQGNSY